MKYYRIQAGFINKVVGDTASNKMVEGYNYGSDDSVYNLDVRGKQNFVPDLDAVQILKRAKLMDIVVSVPLSGIGLLVSDKLIKCILGSTLPVETQIFDAIVNYNEDRHHYYLFYVYDAKEKGTIDWELSTFNETTVGGKPIGKSIKISYETLVRDVTQKGKYYKPSNLVLIGNKLNSDIFRLDYTLNGYYVSENLKDHIERENCKGIEFIPIEKYGFQVKTQ